MERAPCCQQRCLFYIEFSIVSSRKAEASGSFKEVRVCVPGDPPIQHPPTPCLSVAFQNPPALVCRAALWHGANGQPTLARLPEINQNAPWPDLISSLIQTRSAALLVHSSLPFAPAGRALTLVAQFVYAFEAI